MIDKDRVREEVDIPPLPFPYEQFLEVQKALQNANVPTENRTMYYFVWSWWRHPIKRFRQWRAIKKITEES